MAGAAVRTCGQGSLSTFDGVAAGSSFVGLAGRFAVAVEAGTSAHGGVVAAVGSLDSIAIKSLDSAEVGPLAVGAIEAASALGGVVASRGSFGAIAAGSACRFEVWSTVVVFAPAGASALRKKPPIMSVIDVPPIAIRANIAAKRMIPR